MKKRILALIMAATLTFGMSFTSFAAETETNVAVTETERTHTVTIKGVETAQEPHTYEIYQIFTGTYYKNEQNEAYLSNVKWGSNVNTPISFDGKDYSDAVELADVIKTAEQAKALATTLANGNYLSATAFETKTESKAGAGVVFDKLPEGYYLVKDASTLTKDAYSDFIVQLVGDVEVTAKMDTVPTVEKKVVDKNDSVVGDEGYKDTADYDIGDEIPFMITATIVGDISKYSQPYIYTFHDEQSEGLSFNADKLKVYYVHENEKKDLGYTLKTGNDIKEGHNCTFEIETGDLREIAVAGDTIVVEYTSTLNENAKIGAEGNPNKTLLEYSNNPNGEGTGKTPEDTVIVFTYEVVVNKVDQNKAPLAGATFTLYKQYAEAPEGKKPIKADDLKNADKNYKEGDAINYYEVETIATKDVNGNGTQFQSAFQRVDDGNYILVETVTPDGYNTMKPYMFTINASHTQDPEELKLESLSVSAEKNIFSADEESGIISGNIENRQGSLLPSTGGMGTTLFYIIGGMLVVFAGVVLFAKKKMANEQ